MASLVNSIVLILGCLGLGSILSLSLRVPDQDSNAYLRLQAGTASLFTLALLGVPLKGLCWALYGGLVFYLWLALSQVCRTGVTRMRRHFFLFLPFIPLVIKILYTPLWDWDARSIWFFHGKMIFFEHGFYLNKFNPSVVDHFDYPKFIPLFSAIAAKLAGLWNEYLGKVALMLPLVALWLGIAALDLRGWTKAAILIALLWMPGKFMYNGYMDGWMAASCVLGHLFFIDYVNRGHRRNLICAMIAIIFAAYFKNEGIPLAILSTVSMAIVVLMIDVKVRLRGALPSLLLLILVFLPVGVWRYLLWQQGLSNDLFAGNMWIRIQTAVLSGAPSIIWQKVFVDLGTVWLWCASILINGGCVLLRQRWSAFVPTRRQSLSLLAPWLAATAYIALVFMIYLITPYDLDWHIASSADRVMLPYNLLLLLTVVLPVLLPLERRQDAEKCVA
ncbi:hypothetical protein [Desulfovibrio sp. Huiquan2017]|uniref:hypothetical protein n=1 Tax=Desulfovibrio sp. Huiquan2017 TaxID=2816861 RepID=UPI001A91AD21|nr:hypothetical protein [Desulfovibrio sp. Huiquan2017]